MATTVVLNLKVEGQEDIDRLKKALGATEKEFEKVEKQSKKANESVGGMLGILDSLTGGAITKVRGLTSGVGGLTTGFKGLKVAIASTGIGLLIIAIGSLITAFKSSEEGQNKWNKILTVTGVILGNIMDVVADFGETLIAAIENPQKAWNSFTEALSNGYNFIKGQIIDRFSASWTLLSGGVESGILKMRIAWNEFTGDSDEAEELKTQLAEVQSEMIEAAQQIENRNKQIVDVFNEAIAKTKEFIDANKEEVQIAQEVADARAKADKLERELLVERARLEGDIAELRLKSRQEDQFNAKERRQALIDAQALEDQLLKKEVEAAELRAWAQKEENKFARSTKENLDAEAEAEARVLRIRTARLNAQRQTQRELNRINREIEAQEKKQKKEEQPYKEQIDEEISFLERLAKIRAEYAQKNREREEIDEEIKIQLDREAKLKEIEELEINEALKRQAIKEVNDYYDSLDEERIQETNARKLEAEERLQEQRRQMMFNTLNTIAGIYDAESALGKAALVLKQFLLAKELILEAKRTITFGKVAVGKSAVALAEGTAQTAKVGFPQNIPLLIAYAAQAAGIISSINQAVSTSNQAVSSFGGGGGGSPLNNTTAVPAAPSFNVVGNTGINQIGQALNGQADTATRAYVVFGDIEKASQIENEAVQGATL